MPVLPDTTLLCCLAIAAVALGLLGRKLCGKIKDSKDSKLAQFQAAVVGMVTCTAAYAALSQYYEAPWFT